ncbi:hypothetical protein [Streptomyces sp. DSM 40484]|uniref:hypothetical protein n=1 Tax=Streptomyces kroppenstedtii TaxID=3051181 RepID=UPI0028D6B428|nr:hypothetical protein [Streptomyces sp. DSM 40484]
MTGVRLCSLKSEVAQSIPGDGEYHLLRFPTIGEPYDRWGMHEATQPDGYTVANWKTDDRSGLIWPNYRGYGQLYGLVYWEAGDYDEVRSRFVRDPLGITAGGYDSTATEDDAATPGGQFRAKHWGMVVDPATPLGLLVRHDAGSPVKVTLCEFKLAIHPLDEPTEGP